MQLREFQVFRLKSYLLLLLQQEIGKVKLMASLLPRKWSRLCCQERKVGILYNWIEKGLIFTSKLDIVLFNGLFIGLKKVDFHLKVGHHRMCGGVGVDTVDHWRLVIVLVLQPEVDGVGYEDEECDNFSIENNRNIRRLTKTIYWATIRSKHKPPENMKNCSSSNGNEAGYGEDECKH